MQTNLNMIPCRLTYGTFMNIVKSTNRDYSQALTKASDNIHLYISYRIYVVSGMYLDLVKIQLSSRAF